MKPARNFHTSPKNVQGRYEFPLNANYVPSDKLRHQLVEQRLDDHERFNEQSLDAEQCYNTLLHFETRRTLSKRHVYFVTIYITYPFVTEQLQFSHCNPQRVRLFQICLPGNFTNVFIETGLFLNPFFVTGLPYGQRLVHRSPQDGIRRELQSAESKWWRCQRMWVRAGVQPEGGEPGVFIKPFAC